MSGFHVENFCVRGVLSYAFNAVQAGGFAFVTFGSGNAFAVLGLEAEAEFPGIVSVNFELGMYGLGEAFHGLVLNIGG